jgi:hypothetical protein
VSLYNPILSNGIGWKPGIFSKTMVLQTFGVKPIHQIIFLN